MEGDAELRLQEYIQGRKVLYIATKDRNYLRIEQEILLLEKYSNDVDVIVSFSKYYVVRLAYVYWKTLFYKKHFDVVFVGFSPQLVLPVFWWKFKNKILIIDFFISLYDTFVFDRKKFSTCSFVSKVLKKIDMFTLKCADLVICDTKEHSRYFVNELDASPEKIAVLYLSADSRYYYPRYETKPGKLKDKFVVLYFGSVLPLQGVDVILDAIGRIRSKDIHFIMIGPVVSTLKAKLSDKVTFIDWLSQEELSNYIAYSDLCLAGHFNGDIEKAKRVIPGKAYIYEAMGKPMVLGDNEANRERYPQCYGNVSFVKMGDADELAGLMMLKYEGWR